MLFIAHGLCVGASALLIAVVRCVWFARCLLLLLFIVGCVLYDCV